MAMNSMAMIGMTWSKGDSWRCAQLDWAAFSRERTTMFGKDYHVNRGRFQCTRIPRGLTEIHELTNEDSVKKTNKKSESNA